MSKPNLCIFKQICRDEQRGLVNTTKGAPDGCPLAKTLLQALLPFLKRQLLTGVQPLRQDDLAVFARRKMHGFRPLLQFVRHVLRHVDSDGLRVLTNWICSHSHTSRCVKDDQFLMHSDRGV